MLNFFRKLRKDQRGNMIAMLCVCMPLVVGAAGLAADTIQWTLWKRQLQRAADSAAMSGVYDRAAATTAGDTTNTPTAVCHDLSLNMHGWMQLKASGTPCGAGSTVGSYSNLAYDTDCTVSSATNMKYRVCLTLKVQQALPFSSMFMSAPTISASATAASVPSGAEYCVVGLDKSAAVTGVTISGSTYLDIGTCSIIANSTNPTQAASNGTSGKGSAGSGSTVKAASLDAAGGVNYSSNWTVTSYNPGSTPVDDPFYSNYTNIPSSSGSCTKTATVSKSGSTKDYDRSSDSATDTICMNGDQTIQGTVVLGPATYVINAGSLSMSANTASLTCNGCTIILTSFGDNGATTGSVNLTGGSLTLTPPRPVYASDGTTVTSTIGNQTWKGIAVYQDPRAKDNGSTSAQNKIYGNTSTSVQGVVYFGNQSLEYNGGGKDVAACLQVTAKRVTFSGNSYIKAGSQCGGYGMSAIAGGRRVRLVA